MDLVYDLYAETIKQWDLHKHEKLGSKRFFEAHWNRMTRADWSDRIGFPATVKLLWLVVSTSLFSTRMEGDQP